jgi:predicted small integral membrane protein
MGLRSLIGSGVEAFSTRREDKMQEFLAVLIAVVISILIIGFLGKFLWNGYAVKLVTVLKPADSAVQIIALYVLILLLLG